MPSSFKQRTRWRNPAGICKSPWSYLILGIPWETPVLPHDQAEQISASFNSSLAPRLCSGSFVFLNLIEMFLQKKSSFRMKHTTHSPRSQKWMQTMFVINRNQYSLIYLVFEQLKKSTGEFLQKYTLTDVCTEAFVSLSQCLRLSFPYVLMLCSSTFLTCKGTMEFDQTEYIEPYGNTSLRRNLVGVVTWRNVTPGSRCMMS